MNVLIKVFKNKKSRKFKFKRLYQLSCLFRCEQVLNRLKKGCSHPCPPGEQGQKGLSLSSPQTAHTESFMFKGIFESLDFKRECGSSSPKLTPPTHLV